MKMQWKMAGLSAIAVLAIQAVPAHAQAKAGAQAHGATLDRRPPARQCVIARSAAAAGSAR